MTIATLQLGVGVIYALIAWMVKTKPKTTKADIQAMFPVAFTSMSAHSASVFALSAGAVSFGQIVKASEPAFAAVMSVLFYGKKVSMGKWLMLLPVIGGVILASVKELDFAWSALISACVANIFAAIKGNENKKLMDTPGLKDRIGGVSNQFALTTILSFLMGLPIMFAKEGHKFGDFISLLKTNKTVRDNLILSGLSFYGYNELATMTIKKTNAVTQSVANTAKRVIVIVGVALVMGESLEFMKLLGCSVGILGVFLYSIIDMLVPPKKA
jgi:solute carrier family 35, member E1